MDNFQKKQQVSLAGIFYHAYALLEEQWSETCVFLHDQDNTCKV
jgi:hypothetical protein